MNFDADEEAERGGTGDRLGEAGEGGGRYCWCVVGVEVVANAEGKAEGPPSIPLSEEVGLSNEAGSGLFFGIVVAVVVATPRLLRLFDIPTLNSRERSAYKSVFSGAKE